MAGRAARAALPLIGAALGLAAGCRRSHPHLTRGDADVVTLAAPGAAPAGLPRQPEQEGAAPMALTVSEGAGLVVDGTLGPGDEQDQFTVLVPGGSDGGLPDAQALATHALSIEVSPSTGLATAIDVRSAGGLSLGSSTSAAGEPQGLPNVLAVDGGRYLLTIRRTGKAPTAATPYVLVVRLGPLGAGDEREPNDSAESATVLPPSHTSPEVAGYFGGPHDVDWFRIPIGDVAEATVIALELAPPSDVAGALAVHDGAGRRLKSARGRRGEHLVLHNLAPAVLGAGATPPAFFVSAHGEGGSDLDKRYVLSVRSDLASDGEREPNDEAGQATPLATGASMTGRLDDGDVDVFRLAEAPSAVRIEATPPPGLDLVLEVQEGPEARWRRIDGARRGQLEHLDVKGTPGALLVRLSAKRGEVVDEPYQLTITPIEASLTEVPGR